MNASHTEGLAGTISRGVQTDAKHCKILVTTSPVTTTYSPPPPRCVLTAKSCTDVHCVSTPASSYSLNALDALSLVDIDAVATSPQEAHSGGPVCRALTGDMGEAWVHWQPIAFIQGRGGEGLHTEHEFLGRHCSPSPEPRQRLGDVTANLIVPEVQ